MQKQLVAEHCLLPRLFFRSSVYSIGPDLSSTDTHRALLNLAALPCTKQGCSNDLFTITSYIYGHSGSHHVALLLGLAEEGAQALTDREGQWWGGRGAVKGLLPHRFCGVKVPAPVARREDSLHSVAQGGCRPSVIMQSRHGSFM